jgi:hypothetical protein
MFLLNQLGKRRNKMKKNDLLEKVLITPMNENLRNEIVLFLFKETGRSSKSIPRLNGCRTSLNYEEIAGRMKAGAGGTCSSVAKILGISAQGFNNQIIRKSISGNSIIDFHLKTGISIDWLVGSWNGVSSDYIDSVKSSDAEADVIDEQHFQKYVSLVEVYDQVNGVNELKWCLTKHRTCFDKTGKAIEGDYAAMLSLIVRYKDSSGTPDRVKKSNKQYFQVRRVLAYAKGDSKVMRTIDASAKRHTEAHCADYFERPGKTEFRSYSSIEECLKVFELLAEQHRIKVVRPVHDTIAWDYLIGSGSQSAQEWIVDRYHRSQQSHLSRLAANTAEAHA